VSTPPGQSTTSVNLADEKGEKCAEILSEGGTIDDCQEDRTYAPEQPTTPSSSVDPCREWRELADARERLVTEEKRLNRELHTALLANSPKYEELDARHQAVLGELAELQQRILRAEASNYSWSECLERANSAP
jgi:hypothetical protein